MQPYKKELNEEIKSNEVKPFKQESFESLDINATLEENTQTYTKTIGFFGSLSSVFMGIFIFFVLAIVSKSLMSVQEILYSKNIVDYIYLFGLCFLLIVLVWFVYENLREFRDLKKVTSLKKEFQIQKQKPNSSIIPLAHFLINKYEKNPNEDLQKKLKALKEELNSSIIYENIYKNLDKNILTCIDQQAKKAIHKASIQGALSTAISPIPLIDMALIIARSIALSKQIAYMYGFKPGITTTTMLLKQGIINVMFAGIAELATEFTNQVASSSFLAKASKSLGQGAVNGILLARLGYGIMEACRPIESNEEKTSFFKMLINSMKEAMGFSSNEK